jgi:hypothetical protein
MTHKNLRQVKHLTKTLRKRKYVCSYTTAAYPISKTDSSEIGTPQIVVVGVHADTRSHDDPTDKYITVIMLHFLLYNFKDQ